MSEDKIIVPPGFADHVPQRKVLFEVSIPTEDWLANYSDPDYIRALAVRQCDPVEQVAEVIFNGPVEWIKGEHDGFYRASNPSEKP
jgi:hypothetical protein